MINNILTKISIIKKWKKLGFLYKVKGFNRKYMIASALQRQSMKLLIEQDESKGKDNEIR